MGLVASPTLIAAQSSVGWDERGVVTANNLFFRSIGSAVGVAVFGAIANTTLGSQTEGVAVPPQAIADATHDVFVAAAVLGAGDGRGRVRAARWPTVHRRGERGWPGPTRRAGGRSLTPQP